MVNKGAYDMPSMDEINSGRVDKEVAKYRANRDELDTHAKKTETPKKSTTIMCVNCLFFKYAHKLADMITPELHCWYCDIEFKAIYSANGACFDDIEKNKAIMRQCDCNKKRKQELNKLIKTKTQELEKLKQELES